MEIDKKRITKEQLEKALECKTAEWQKQRVMT